ncbi:MAG: nitrogen regulation protein NR(II) [Gammaproteobacteria bacterium]
MHKKVLDHLNEAILLFDKNLILTYINTTGEMLFTDSYHHLVGVSARDLFMAANSAVLQNLQLCLSYHETIVDNELLLELPHQAITINFSATPLLEQEDLTGVIVELQRAGNHLRISKEAQLLAQHNTARMLIRGLAHEIKNPLGGLRGAAQLLDFELVDPELKEYTQIIIAESDRLQMLMDRMLGPNKPPQKQDLNIHEVLERVRQLVEAEGSGHITIKRDYDPSIPTIEADRNQLIQAVLNIVRNAVQALGMQQHPGEIVLKTRICRQITIGRKRYKLVAKIDISDNGPGIPADMLERIFYPMITGRAEGTGLGLSIAQSLVNQHNGMIECSSVPGNTVFTVYLPVENHHG